jgi:tetratricopeptide (TPR) repeat protein
MVPSAMARRWLAVTTVALLALAALAQWWTTRPDSLTPPPLAAPRTVSATAATAQFVGSQSCAGCHTAEHGAWQGSQHAHAMAHAGPDTVLGNFSDQSFEYAGIRSRFSQRDGRYLVTTDGPDGALSEFEVLYTFGLAPLQQYLVDLGGGRLQALSIAWDTRPAEQGGQRWFHIYPDEAVTHRDPLHWTRPSQNWNFMCADCHVTDFRKGYSAATDTFDSRWAELGVGCEACHGPGSAHLAWAAGDLEQQNRGLLRQFEERRTMHWQYRLGEVTAQPASAAPAMRTEQAVCAQCHAMRSQVAEGFQQGGELLDHYRPELLRDPLYHADGQQREEVFISASFAQSRMHAAGVTCSDCHEPHSQRLRAEGNSLCATCHSPAHFDRPSHHFHPQGTAGAQCVNCHMPQTTYMVIDPRRDHQLSVPRPHLAASLGTPDACTGCHAEQSPDWAAAHVETWYPAGQWRAAHFATAFAAADSGDPSAQPELQQLAENPLLAPVTRASAARRILPDSGSMAVLQSLLRSSDPLLRQGALEALESASVAQRRALLAPLLSDPLRSIRTAVARLLADVPLPAELQPAFDTALADYEAELALHAERADYLNQLGLLRLRQGRTGEAEDAWDKALRRDPLHTASRLNLADLLRGQGREAAVERLLREGLALTPGDGLLHYALGFSLVRQARRDEALVSFRQAFLLRPDDPRIRHVLAVALEPVDPRAALDLLDEGVTAHPFDIELHWAAAAFHARHGNAEAAHGHAVRLLELAPLDPRPGRLLEQRAKPSGRQ